MATQDGTAKKYGSIAEVAALTGLSEGTIRNLLAIRQLTPLRPVRGRVLIELAEVDRFMHESANRERGARGLAHRDGASAAQPTVHSPDAVHATGAPPMQTPATP